MSVDELCMGCMEPRGDAESCAECGYVEGTPTANPVHLPPRTVLRNHYVLGRVLGHGGFGIAYLAWDPDLQMKVAVKEYLPGDVATRGSNGTSVTPYGGESRDLFEYGLTKFLEEGRAVVKFHDHPGIATVLGFFHENGTGYLVMQYLDGMSFMEYLRLKGGRIPFPEAVAIAMPVLDTLRVVHEGGVLHRDISPHNIYITKTRQVKLLDFGAARHALGDRSKSLSVILKAGYSPFEQYLSKGRQGPWTDIYALAATIYRAIAGEAPPEAPSRVAGDDVEPPRTRGVQMTAEAETVLLRALAIDQKDRYQKVVEFQVALLRVTPNLRSAESVVDDIDDEQEDEDKDRKDHKDRKDRKDRKRDDDRDVSQLAGTVKKALRGAVDVLDRPARAIGDRVQRTTGLGLAPDNVATARPLGLWVGLAAGLLGVWGGYSLLRLFLGFAAATSDVNVLVMVLRVIVGTTISASMAIGAAAALAHDRRGPALVWAAGWGLLIAGVAGIALQLVMQLPQTGLAFLPAAIWGETTILMQVLTLPFVSLLLLWLRAASPTTRASSAPGSSTPVSSTSAPPPETVPEPRERASTEVSDR